MSKPTSAAEDVLRQIDALVPHFNFVCSVHGDKCDPQLTSDDLKSLASAYRDLERENRAMREGLLKKLDCVIENALNDYHTSGIVDVDGDGMQLVDVFTPGNEETIAVGQAEVEALHDFLMCSIQDALAESRRMEKQDAKV